MDSSDAGTDDHGGTGAPGAPKGRDRRRKLGEVLVEAGVIDEQQLRTALSASAQARSERLGQTVARLGYAADEEIAQALARQFGLEFGSGRIDTHRTASAAMPESLAKRNGVVPLGWDGQHDFRVACTDPMDVVALDDARLAVGARELRRVVVTPSTLERLHEQVYGSVASDLLEAVAEDDDEAPEPIEVEDAPVVRLAERLLTDAVAAGASDIHFEPGPSGTCVRFRIDGALRRATTVPRGASASLVSHLKILAQMDIAERRLPQDGRMRLRLPSGELDVRAATLPSLHGETLVLRLLPRGDQQLGIGALGLDDDQRAEALAAAERPQGLILLTGPTGSGKTSTMYALLRVLVGGPRKIVTIEDPIEYEVEGASQSQVDARVGLTFARSLRTVLRQDPDVVMVGEIRDAETAELALQASMTGHLVLSTLHTNDAPSAVARLCDLGVARYLVADALTAVIGQRLVRRLCEACARPKGSDDGAPPATSGQGAGTLLPVGCRACGHTGYRGRTGLFEVLAMDATLQELARAQAPASKLRRAALAAGMTSLRGHGLAKAGIGVTSAPEVLRVTPDDEQETACPRCAEQVEPEFWHCPWCGEQLRPPSCATCGRDLRPGWRVCPDCGQRPAD